MSTGIAPLSSSAYFTSALYSLKNTSNNVANSVARLSSGNRIVNVGDDVASFSVASRLQSQLSGLRQASSNVAQASSLLQVASGGLQQISELLNSLKSIAIQASSSALTSTERGYLQQEFTALYEEIDSIADTTTFNSIVLLDGTLSGGNELITQTTAATKASASITLSANPSAGETIVLNGVTFTADTDFAVGASALITASNLATALNNSTDTAISQATYEASGSSITITAKSGGTLGNQYVIDKAASTAAFTTDGATTNVADVVTLAGGLDNGLSVNTTQATGTIGNTIITTQSQESASVTLTVSGAISDGETLSIGDGNGGLITFTFRTAPATSTEILIGASTEETLQNAIDTISQYSADNTAGDNYGLRQLEYSVINDTLVISNRNVGDVNDLDGNALAISETLANGSVSAASFNNGVNTGVDTSGINNGDFVGEISGFTATFVGADSITVSLTVGSSTYTAAITDTTPAGDTTIRFSSDTGGYFDIELDGGQGSAVTNQSDATSYATRLDSAFGGLDFYQERIVTDYTTTGSLLGSSSSIQMGDSNTIRLNSVTVSAPSSPGTDGTIDFDVNGETFRASSGLGGGIGAYETVTFTSLTDSNEFIVFTNGATALDFSTDSAAETLQDELATAFAVDEPGDGTDFQVGVEVDDVINVTLGSAKTYTIFNGSTPDVGSVANAGAAQTAIDTASDSIQTMISYLAGKQSSFNAAEANLQTSIIGISAAHSALADTDIVSESTLFAQETLKLNAGIAIVAQALSLQSGLLNLVAIGGKG